MWVSYHYGSVCHLNFIKHSSTIGPLQQLPSLSIGCMKFCPTAKKYHLGLCSIAPDSSHLEVLSLTVPIRSPHVSVKSTLTLRIQGKCPFLFQEALLIALFGSCHTCTGLQHLALVCQLFHPPCSARWFLVLRLHHVVMCPQNQTLGLIYLFLIHRVLSTQPDTWEIFNEFNEWVDLSNSVHTKQKCHGLYWARAWQSLEESLEGFLLLVWLSHMVL